jgi:hypothetical protein
VFTQLFVAFFDECHTYRGAELLRAKKASRSCTQKRDALCSIIVSDYGCVSDIVPLFVLVDMMKNPAPLLAFGNQPPTAVLE